MRTALIASPRTRSTMFGLALENELQCKYIGEVYTDAAKDGINYHTVTDEIFSQDNIIVKLMGHNVTYIEESDFLISDFQIPKYDRFYLLERSNFFEQCCSLHIASMYDIWHNPKDTKHRKEFDVDYKIHKTSKTLHRITAETIKINASSLSGYLSLKNEIMKMQVSFMQYDYNDIEKFGEHQSALTSLGFQYKTMFSNYYLSDTINDLANKYFCRNTCESDIEQFNAEIDKIFNE